MGLVRRRGAAVVVLHEVIVTDGRFPVGRLPPARDRSDVRIDVPHQPVIEREPDDRLGVGVIEHEYERFGPLRNVVDLQFRVLVFVHVTDVIRHSRTVVEVGRRDRQLPLLFDVLVEQ